ncbi:hypothetical protein TSARBOMBA_206 [Bacillus phage TsarBomba]|uniref:Uncharacterized protein n=1 Tax=Bacillus phage TsarBomba TaxID=1690456 RepID=A0A0K2D084_9CAUD|nr:hypothetical protein TSARBOMBA_206 [Bacillus phage TsarBomba]ALA13077.1 hypothetical protein TSARBOMBA_206 [Bacillus phage TsarBomba]
MKEILTSGKVRQEFKRLGISPMRTYGGAHTTYKVYQMTDEEFEILKVDAKDNNPDHWKHGGWRWSTGSNAGDPDIALTVNGHKLFCWSRDEDREDYGYGGLLSYLSNVMGCSAFRNVCALTMDLARHNNMTLGELFTKYEGYREEN